VNAPSTGTSDMKAITTPHSSGDGMPISRKARPPRTPWIAAEEKVPSMVARVMSVNFRMIFSSRVLSMGESLRSSPTTFSPSLKK